MKIQLLYFPGCPNVDATRAALHDALASEKLDLPIEEVDVEDPEAPDWARGWGSPTILIDGKEIYDQESSGAPACRVYVGGAPTVEVIRSRIAGALSSGSKRIALPIIGAITAAIAASACCLVPAALAVVGLSGAGFASRFAHYRTYLLIASAITLALGFWVAYRREADDCGCGVLRRRPSRAASRSASKERAGLPSMGYCGVP